MALTTLQIVGSAECDFEGLLRSIRGVELLRDEDNRLLYSSGNSAVIFKVAWQGGIFSMKCYLGASPYREIIYGEKLRKAELYVFVDETRGAWVDVVMEPWIEGVSLSSALRRYVAARDTKALRELSRSFDDMAHELLCLESAHGDITCDNIIVDSQNRLHLIDFDGAFTPALAGRESVELGTVAYQHPLRNRGSFDSDIDDYSIALISTALSSIALDCELYYRFYYLDGLMISPSQAVARSSAALDVVSEMFARTGDVASYRIARLLTWSHYALPNLRDLLTFKAKGASAGVATTPYVEGYLWGYLNAEGERTLPPLFDSCFDFSEGYATVKVGTYYHYINEQGVIALNCSDCQAVKPVRNGQARVLRGGEWYSFAMQ